MPASDWPGLEEQLMAAVERRPHLAVTSCTAAICSYKKKDNVRLVASVRQAGSREELVEARGAGQAALGGGGRRV